MCVCRVLVFDGSHILATHVWWILAEVDGNRTRQTRITRLNRFEDGEAHQALGHLRR
jgi:hypothetical protein